MDENLSNDQINRPQVHLRQPINIIAAIRNRIFSIIFQEIILRKEVRIIEELKSIFLGPATPL